MTINQIVIELIKRTPPAKKLVQLFIKTQKWRSLDLDTISNARNQIKRIYPRPLGKSHWHNPQNQAYQNDLTVIVP
ncbi:MAG: hypothetical protein IKT44_04015, partial [Clostridia bacterium]|nr:hypothetical protein [Clostridia bacterium]